MNTTTTRRDADLRFILTTDDYRAAGVIVIEDGRRHVGYDTSGQQLFNRKDFDGACAAAKAKGLRTVAPGYYGIGADRPEGEAAPAYRRNKEARKAAREEGVRAEQRHRAEWLPLGKPRAVVRSADVRPLAVIGDVDQSLTGNTIFRVGHLVGEGGWEQTDHMVLTPAERDWLIQTLTAQAAIAPATTA